jgi:type I restriction enzyme M protein
VICDPACGSAGFLVAASEYLRQHHPEVLREAKLKKHFHQEAFHAMPRILAGACGRHFKG